MGDPVVISDAKRYRETVREHTALRKLEAAAKRYFKILDDIEGNESLLEDPDFAEEAKAEIERLKAEIPTAELAVLAGLLPLRARVAALLRERDTTGFACAGALLANWCDERTSSTR